MRVAALARGGLAVYGGRYDPRQDQAIIGPRSGDSIALEIEFPSAPTSASASGSGMDATDLAIAGSKVSLTLSNVQSHGCVDVSASLSGGTRTVRIRAAEVCPSAEASDFTLSATTDGSALDFTDPKNLVLNAGL